MPSLKRFVVAHLCACAVALQSAHAWTVTPRNAAVIDNTAAPGLMETSGLVYRGTAGASYEAFAAQDSGNQLVTVSFGLAADGSITSAAATATRTLSPGFDFEGVTLGPTGSVLVAEEGTPGIRRYNESTGAAISSLGMPAVFNNDRPNFAFESLTRVPGTTTYWTANEESLTTDGPQSNTSAGTTVRLQQFTYDSAGTLALGPQFAYHTDPIHVGTTTDSKTRSGLVDLMALPDSSLLALERSLGITGTIFGIPLYQYESRIYRVTFSGATDISGAPYDAGLVGQPITLATKTLLWKGQAGGGLGQNMEGLALGPQLPGGDWSLLGIVDNSGGSDPASANTLVAFRLTPSVAGDFNGNGAVDAADYIMWRKGQGTTFTNDNYTTWRANFAASAAGAAGFDSASAAEVPEPAGGVALMSAWLLMSCCRRAACPGFF